MSRPNDDRKSGAVAAAEPGARMNEWLTYGQAAVITERSRRTIRRWAGDPKNGIRVQRNKSGETLVQSRDVLRTERLKTAYRDTPTFGRVRF